MSHIQNLIADYLKHNNYPDTLKQFEIENRKPITSEKLAGESLVDIVEDRINFNAITKGTAHLKIGLTDEQQQVLQSVIEHWKYPYPNKPQELVDLNGLVISLNYYQGLIYITTNDSKIYVIKDKQIIKEIKSSIVIKKIIPIEDRVLLFGTNGIVYLKTLDFKDLSDIQAHKRLIVDGQYIRHGENEFVVTLGWDFYIRVFKLENDKIIQLSELKLSQQGTCFDVTIYEERLVIIVGKLENTLLEVITLQSNELKCLYKISINDAEFTSSSFSPRFITIQRSAVKPLIAVATSHEPYMRIIIVPLKDLNSNSIKRQQIIKNINTLSPQDKFSQPIISWRKGTDKKVNGLWIMGDDGVIRGIDLIDDYTIELKEGGHKSKIKEFITINKENQENQEILITADINRDIIQWVID
ncbi:unnamed protein product [Candida verbasci]|uniref:LisH domain-containing protein n=1 Tax=Candida verbasci TaxID=1227364 RepID=A0A9W4X9M0_9ASCO|nr:unnamed protein product [Candida verbasci]